LALSLWVHIYDILNDDINDNDGAYSINVSVLSDPKDVIYDGRKLNDVGLLKFYQRDE